MLTICSPQTQSNSQIGLATSGAFNRAQNDRSNEIATIASNIEIVADGLEGQSTFLWLIKSIALKKSINMQGTCLCPK